MKSYKAFSIIFFHIFSIGFISSLFGEEYVYSVDTNLTRHEWYLAGGEVFSNFECPYYRIKFDSSFLTKMLHTPKVKYSATNYEYSDGCSGGGGLLVYRKYLIIDLVGGSTGIYCHFWDNDTLKSISKIFINSITNSSFAISNDTLFLCGRNGRIWLLSDSLYALKTKDKKSVKSIAQ